MRTHFAIPADLLEEFDRRVPRRKRSETVAALIAEWVRRQRAKEMLDWAGFVRDEDHPEWQTDEDVYRWVRQLRSEWGNRWDDVDGGAMTGDHALPS